MAAPQPNGRAQDGPARSSAALPSALERLAEIRRRLAGRRPAFFLDYDGTLTPIVETPDKARLSGEMREILRRLADRYPVSVVSGRDLENVRWLVGLGAVAYAGSHGFDIAGPGGRMEHAGALAMLPALDAAERALRERLADVPGLLIERKKFSLAVHSRRVAEADLPRVETAVAAVAAAQPDLRVKPGKKVHDFQPRIDWDKGRAALWLLEALGLSGSDILPLYLGDDITDEDAFRALSGRGINIIVRDHAEPRSTAADYALESVADVERFLASLAGEGAA